MSIDLVIMDLVYLEFIIFKHFVNRETAFVLFRYSFSRCDTETMNDSSTCLDMSSLVTDFRLFRTTFYFQFLENAIVDYGKSMREFVTKQITHFLLPTFPITISSQLYTTPSLIKL